MIKFMLNETQLLKCNKIALKDQCYDLDQRNARLHSHEMIQGVHVLSYLEG